MTGDQWDKYKSKRGPAEVEVFDPIWDLGRKSAWDYYRQSGDYECNPSLEKSRHISNGFSNFDMEKMDDNMNDWFSGADNKAGLRRG